jgi:hypothetical protein
LAILEVTKNCKIKLSSFQGYSEGGNMYFQSGKHKGEAIQEVVINDRHYVEFMLDTWSKNIVKNRKNGRESSNVTLNGMIAEAQTCLQRYIKPKEDIYRFPYQKGPGGKKNYKGILITDLVQLDPDYVRNRLKGKKFIRDFPETYEYMLEEFLKYHSLEKKATVQFYVIVFPKEPWLKLGQTEVFFPKRLYSYHHSPGSIYLNNGMDFSLSHVWLTDDKDLEDKAKDFFRNQRPKKIREQFFVTVKEVQDFVDYQVQANPDFFYEQKPMMDFIPWKTSAEFNRKGYIKINRFHKFREDYERKIEEDGKLSWYNPKWMNSDEY